MQVLNTHLEVVDDGFILVGLIAKSTFLQHIHEAQKNDPELVAKRRQVVESKDSKFHIGTNDSFYYRNRICVPRNLKVKQNILQEAHSSRYSIHLGSNKIYNDLKQMYWWLGIK